jgi:type IV secretory pathway VirB2 component (pilin)
MDHQVILVVTTTSVALAVVALAWFTLAKIAQATPVKLATGLTALAAFAGAVATIMAVLRP